MFILVDDVNLRYSTSLFATITGLAIAVNYIPCAGIVGWV